MKPEDFFQIPLVEKVGAGVMMRGDEVKYWQERDTDRKWKHFYFLGHISTGLSSGGVPLFEVLKGKVSSSHLSHSTLLYQVWIKAQDKVSRASDEEDRTERYKIKTVAFEGKCQRLKFCPQFSILVSNTLLQGVSSCNFRRWANNLQ